MPLLYINLITGVTKLGIYESKEDYIINSGQHTYPMADLNVMPVYTREEITDWFLSTVHAVLKDQIGIISTPYTTTQSRKAIEIVYRTKVFVLSDEGGDHLLLKQEITEDRRKSKFWKNVKRFEITGTLQNWVKKAETIVKLIEG